MPLTRSGLLGADELAYTASNVALTVGLARSSTVNTFAGFAMAYAIGAGLLMVHRALCLESAMLSSRPRWRTDVTTTGPASLALATTVAFGLLFLPQIGQLGRQYLVAIPLLLGHDLVRHDAIRAGQTGWLLLADGIWAVIVVVATTPLAGSSPLAAWMLGLVISSGLLLIIALLPGQPAIGRRFDRRALGRALGPATEQGGAVAANLLLLGLLGGVAPAGLAALRVFDTAFGPAHVVLGASRGQLGFLTARLARTPVGRRLGPWMQTTIALTLAVGCSILVVAVQQFVGLGTIFGPAGISAGTILFAGLAFKIGQLELAAAAGTARLTGRNYPLLGLRLAAVTAAMLTLVTTGSVTACLLVGGLASLAAGIGLTGWSADRYRSAIDA